MADNKDLPGQQYIEGCEQHLEAPPEENNSLGSIAKIISAEASREYRRLEKLREYGDALRLQTLAMEVLSRSSSTLPGNDALLAKLRDRIEVLSDRIEELTNND